ncbi:hypothetical protein CO051_03710 [Candidatus Roizmanbacteria bacterium CG_4_9_14_0_2_um_filter_39_13]|uniref:DUF433 domain-containing protein n=1 Tax=Candidatus Roizmanbacteria bacterium CG_4_9_14_0_2_um_filter_39_13 TaxID=1974839 RepID=A0A2M8EYU3_9BACT|nr:MAG: hypothetical protein COY15_06085 [Candidatus Roizmanbacteria bacterium CG_4_10_14_0_2_um_filter_39_12]PJC31801.1 MAG: hypothetical protein CO051_03710 [Candidatus Roizmanbacteria bacterium CG_4_9_14_0_2_um_filter_39_13]
MTSLNALFNEGEHLPLIPSKLLRSFSFISTDPKIRSGWPHIKNTRVLVTDIFRAQVRGNTIESMVKDFKSMGIKINSEALEEAYKFTLEWLHYLNEKEKNNTS